MSRHRPELQLSPGNIVFVYNEAEAGALAKQWIEVYAENALGANIGAFLWHTFSANRYPCIAKYRALALYQQQITYEVVVLSNDRKTAVLTDALPTECTATDYCVFPVNLAWTMAFTHEDGWLGPFFAKHPDYCSLAARNELEYSHKQRKARQLEHARLKDWL